MATMFTATFRSPLPPPAILERYETIIPNGAERIMALVEKQAEHRRSIARSNLAAQERGQHYALTVVVLGMISGTMLAAFGRPVEGLVAILVPLATVAGIFIHVRRSQSRERAEELHALMEPGASDPATQQV